MSYVLVARNVNSGFPTIGPFESTRTALAAKDEIMKLEFKLHRRRTELRVARWKVRYAEHARTYEETLRMMIHEAEEKKANGNSASAERSPDERRP